MPDTVEQREQNSKTRKGSARRRGAIVVVLALVVVGVFAVVSMPDLLVHSDVATLPSATPPTTDINQPPEILGLTVASDRIEPFSICDMQCDARDLDGDTLTYEWTVSDGEIYGEGAAVEWGSPVSEGLYRVSVKVDDGRGGSADYSVPLHVKANAVPVLASLTADSDWVFVGKSIRLACDVSDADGDNISLDWSATGGTIYGQGNAIVWLAPDTTDVYWITVTASDAYGGESRRAMPISVTRGEPPEIVGLFLRGENTDMLQKRGNDWIIYQGRAAGLTCATPDGSGPYTYEWSADFGTLTQNGNEAIWTAPTKRVGATILVVVSDEYGNSSSASVLVYVETCTCSF